MTNTVTADEREALVERASTLLTQGYSRDYVIARLMVDGVSRARAKTAVAKAQLEANRPRRFR